MLRKIPCFQVFLVTFNCFGVEFPGTLYSFTSKRGRHAWSNQVNNMRFSIPAFQITKPNHQSNHQALTGDSFPAVCPKNVATVVAIWFQRLLLPSLRAASFLLLSHSFSLIMKTLLSEETLKVPKGVKITIKSKKVEVKGKHGELSRDFKHLPIELFLGDGGKKVIARMYFAKSKQCSMLNTVCSHISNLFDGVETKFEYKMRLVYAHFPINVNVVNGGKTIEIRNFLGEKVVRTVHMIPGVIVEKSANTKDEIIVFRCRHWEHRAFCCPDPPILLEQEEGYPKVLGWHLCELSRCQGRLKWLSHPVQQDLATSGGSKNARIIVCICFLAWSLSN